jgi:hypothetical protein
VFNQKKKKKNTMHDYTPQPVTQRFPTTNPTFFVVPGFQGQRETKFVRPGYFHQSSMLFHAPPPLMNGYRNIILNSQHTWQPPRNSMMGKNAW